MERIEGEVARVLFRNSDNGYTVARLEEVQFGEITVVGNIPEPHIGDKLCATGDWVTNPKFGVQFKIDKWESCQPATLGGIKEYLSSMVSGIGLGLAERIVKKFGMETINIIENDPARLLEINGIGKAKLEKITASWAESRDMRDIMIFLQNYDISAEFAVKIYKRYGSDSIEIVRKNPYRLADDFWGIGFRKADVIAQKMGIATDSEIRIRCGIKYALQTLSNAGHCYATWSQLEDTTTKMLNVPSDFVAITMSHMIATHELFKEPELLVGENNEPALYLPLLHAAECGVAERINRMALMKVPPDKRVELIMARLSANDDGTGCTAIATTSDKPDIRYDSLQLDAIRTALTSKIMVITGGPGTGKSTTIMGIIDAFNTEDKSVILAAPTGRAAKRMTELTGLEAKTIHRLLEYAPEGAGWTFMRNEDNPLEDDVLIVDECSMIDISLMYHLLAAVPFSMTVILVGDVDQLPSVGPGNVLKDIINSGVVPVIRLEHIFRQAQGSKIITNAHRINRGESIEVTNDCSSDFFFASIPDQSKAAQYIVDLCTTKLPEALGVDKFRDIQVLSPMRKGGVGTIELNRLLQEALNPNPQCIRKGVTEFRIYDKVMQIRNNYDKDVFNGDIGVISRIDTKERTLTVMFDNRSADYEYGELDELVLAYATTIHKSQGSEFPVVIIPLLMQHYVMLQRNLLYTGVTRAKKTIVLVGDKRAVQMAINNATIQNRNTLLSWRIGLENSNQAGTVYREDMDELPSPSPIVNVPATVVA